MAIGAVEAGSGGAKFAGVGSGLTEQPGWKITVTRDGMTTITTQFACRAELLIDLLPPIGAKHNRFSFASLDEITGVREEGDLAKIDCVYRGTQPGVGQGTQAATYQLIAQTKEEPIETHERYKDVSLQDLKKIRYYIDNAEGNAALPTFSDPKATELLEKKLRGQEVYLQRNLVWRETITSSASIGSIENVGKISVPVGGAPGNGTGNWLLSSNEQEKQGSAYRRVREWMASGHEGWDTDIY
jgi:hypothetical protein